MKPSNPDASLCKAVLSDDGSIEETIKWSSPTFMYKGNIASFFFNAKKFVSLMFHKGATIKDESGLLEGEGKETRMARFQDLADVEKKKEALQAIIREWIRMQDQGYGHDRWRKGHVPPRRGHRSPRKALRPPRKGFQDPRRGRSPPRNVPKTPEKRVPLSAEGSQTPAKSLKDLREGVPDVRERVPDSREMPQRPPRRGPGPW